MVGDSHVLLTIMQKNVEDSDTKDDEKKSNKVAHINDDDDIIVTDLFLTKIIS